MTIRIRLLSAILVACVGGILAIGASAQENPGPRDAGRRKVLVELYTSQGCNSCPPASKLLGQLRALGYGPDQIVPIGFHVDYFNEPWADPYSDRAFSRRQLEYNGVLRRNDLYFTPMLMVDGALPMLGSDRPKVLQSIERARKQRPGVALKAWLEGEGRSKLLHVEISRPSAEAGGRKVIVGVASTEGPLTTKVPSGENAGKALVEHYVARDFTHRTGRLDRSEPIRLSFPVILKDGQNPSATRIAVFVQDQAGGMIYQADSLAWSEPKSPR